MNNILVGSITIQLFFLVKVSSIVSLLKIALQNQIIFLADDL